jgi:hypothetical protein
MEAREHAQRFTELRKVCDAIPKERGHMRDRGECLWQAHDAAGYSMTAEDNVYLTEMMRTDIAVDAGKMTLDEAAADLAQVRYELAQDAAAERAQRAATAATIIGAMPQYHPYVLPTPQPYVAPAPRSFNCTTLGAFTNCSGY